MFVRRVGHAIRNNFLDLSISDLSEHFFGLSNAAYTRNIGELNRVAQY